MSSALHSFFSSTAGIMTLIAAITNFSDLVLPRAYSVLVYVR